VQYQIRRCTTSSFSTAVLTLQLQISRPQSCDQTHRKIKASRWSVCVQSPTLHNRHLVQSGNSDAPQLVSNTLPGRYLRSSLNNKVFWDFNTIQVPCSIYTTHHLLAVPKNITHRPHITYQQFQPIYHTVYTSPTSSSNQYTTPSTHHLPAVPNNMPHRLHITYQQFQPICHTVYTSPTTSSNQYTTPSTHHLPAFPTNIPHRLHITYQQFQLICHTVYTSPTSSSNQYATPSTHHLPAVPTNMPHRLHIAYTLHLNSPHQCITSSLRTGKCKVQARTGHEGPEGE